MDRSVSETIKARFFKPSLESCSLSLDMERMTSVESNKLQARNLPFSFETWFYKGETSVCSVKITHEYF